VRHTSLGVGKIVALEPAAVHVFFPDGDKRFAAKLRLPAARALLRTEGFEPNQWLAGLTAFSLDAESGRYALSATFLTDDQAVEQLLAALPDGFATPAAGASKVKPGRAARWHAAHAAWAKLPKDEAAKLAADGTLAPLLARVREVEKLVAPLHPPADVDVLEAALADEDTAGPYFVALTDLLAAPTPGRARFEKLFAAVRGLPIEPSHQWLLATLLPFVAAPTRHVLLRPRGSCVAAERLGCDLRFETTPTWPAYSAMLALNTRWLERLAAHGAADFVDVETFLHVVATGRRLARPARTAAPKRPAAGAKVSAAARATR